MKLSEKTPTKDWTSTIAGIRCPAIARRRLRLRALGRTCREWEAGERPVELGCNFSHCTPLKKARKQRGGSRPAAIAEEFSLANELWPEIVMRTVVTRPLQEQRRFPRRISAGDADRPEGRREGGRNDQETSCRVAVVGVELDVCSRRHSAKRSRRRHALWNQVRNSYR
jgi:hypothetical protein